MASANVSENLVRALNTAAITLGLLTLAAIALSGAGWRSMAASTVVASAGLLNRAVLQRFGARTAMALLLIVTWLALSATAIHFAGVHTDLAIIYPFLIGAAGWALGMRWLAVIAGCSAALFLALGIGEIAGVYTPTPRARTIEVLTAILTGIAISVLLTWFAVRDYAVNLARAESLSAANQERERLMKTVFDNMPGGVALFGPDARVILCNRYYALLFGRRVIDMPGMHFADLAPPELRTMIQRKVDALAGGEPQRYQRTHVMPDGQSRELEVTLTPLMGGAGLNTVVQVIDITEKIRLQNELRELNDHLEQRVQERTEALAEAMDSLHKAQRELIAIDAKAALGAMVAGIAHEVSTPIANSVLTASALSQSSRDFVRSVEQGQLRRSEINSFTESLQSGTDIILRNLESAADLMRNFKQRSADQASEQRRHFDLAETARTVLETLRPQIKHKPHEVRIEIPDGLTLDSYPGPLGQVLTNLINNAYLHAFEGMTKGLLRIWAEPLASGHIEIRVSDNGRGMSDEVKARIFQPFFSTKIGAGGTGLGMSIVEDIVRHKLGGIVQVESAEGRGTTFVICLPVTAPNLE